MIFFPITEKEDNVRYPYVANHERESRGEAEDNARDTYVANNGHKVQDDKLSMDTGFYYSFKT